MTGVFNRHRFRTAATSVRGDAYTVGKASCRTGLSSTSARSMRANHRHAGAHKRVTAPPKVTPLYMELPQRPSADRLDRRDRKKWPQRILRQIFERGPGRITSPTRTPPTRFCTVCIPPRCWSSPPSYHKCGRAHAAGSALLATQPNLDPVN